MTQQLPLALILGAPVLAAASHVGVATDVFVDPGASHLIGLEVTGPNDRRWFLPWVAAKFESGSVLAASPLVFVSREQIDFYLRHSAKLDRNEAVTITVDADGRLLRHSERVNATVASDEGAPVP